MTTPVFTYCPIESRFIDSPSDALSYYAHRLVGSHVLTVKGRGLVVVFNPEEIHLFTEDASKMRRPPPPEHRIDRPGRSGEVRYFSAERARLMDKILWTIEAPVTTAAATIHRGVMLFGPADTTGSRIAVVVAPEARSASFFVRTMFVVSPRDFAKHQRGSHRPPWPPK